ncbi:YgiT-type zinc finger protein [Deltaproteobacteria bacterium TL4]
MISTRESQYDYGECEICNTALEEQYITQDFWIRGELVVIDHVLAGVCPQCGEKVVNAETGHQVFNVLENTAYLAKAPRITVPIVKLDEC